MVRGTKHHTHHISPHPGPSLQLYSTHRMDILVLGDLDSALGVGNKVVWHGTLKQAFSDTKHIVHGSKNQNDSKH